MSLVEWAEQELERLGDPDKGEDSPQQWVNQNVLELLQTFIKQGHSGYSAAYTLSVFARLSAWKPLTPLTGEDDEWILVDENSKGNYRNLWQNKRCSTVFKRELENGEMEAYNSEAVIFSDDDGETWYTDKNSHKEIGFPYEVPDEPEKEYVWREEGK